MFADGFNRHAEEFGNEFLGEPDGFILIAHFQTPLSGLGSENEKLRRAVADLYFPVAHRKVRHRSLLF
jgi:hypothetical protein